jgi:hypothetical protein
LAPHSQAAALNTLELFFFALKCGFKAALTHQRRPFDRWTDERQERIEKKASYSIEQQAEKVYMHLLKFNLSGKPAELWMFQ